MNLKLKCEVVVMEKCVRLLPLISRKMPRLRYQPQKVNILWYMDLTYISTKMFISPGLSRVTVTHSDYVLHFVYTVLHCVGCC